MFFQVERVIHEACKGKTQLAKVKMVDEIIQEQSATLNESKPSIGSQKQDLDTSIRGTWESLLRSS